MIKKIRLGLSAVAAFAFTLSLFAQESDYARAEPSKGSISSQSILESRNTVDELLPHHTSRFDKKTASNRSMFAGVLFKYTGTPGNESDPSLWEEVNENEIDECDGQDHACAVRVKPEFTTGTAGSRTIDASTLDDYSNLMPVINSGAGLVPDPAAAGSSPDQPYVDQSEIYNKDL